MADVEVIQCVVSQEIIPIHARVTCTTTLRMEQEMIVHLSTIVKQRMVDVELIQLARSLDPKQTTVIATRTTSHRRTVRRIARQLIPARPPMAVVAATLLAR